MSLVATSATRCRLYHSMTLGLLVADSSARYPNGNLFALWAFCYEFGFNLEVRVKLDVWTNVASHTEEVNYH